MILPYDCAMRLNELPSMRICGIMMEGGFPSILIHGKGGKERRVRVSESSVGRLEDCSRVFHGGPSDGACLLSTAVKGAADKMPSGNARRIIAQYAAAARKGRPHAPEKIHPHMFRRTRAAYLYQDGTAIELISAILGHSSLETAELYAHPSVEQLRGAQNSVSAPTKDETPLLLGKETEMAHRCGIR
jgi:site-specific recombinase XerD